MYCLVEMSVIMLLSGLCFYRDYAFIGIYDFIGITYNINYNIIYNITYNIIYDIIYDNTYNTIYNITYNMT